MKTEIVSRHTANSKPVKQEVNGTVILPPLVFPGQTDRRAGDRQAFRHAVAVNHRYKQMKCIIFPTTYVAYQSIIFLIGNMWVRPVSAVKCWFKNYVININTFAQK
jgi:hypothetical protein